MLLVPKLVEAQQQRALDFPARVLAWLQNLEDLLSARRVSQVSGISAVRSALVAAQRGNFPAGSEVHGRLTRTRLLEGVASQSLQRGVQLLEDLIKVDRARFEEGAKIAQQIIAAGLSRGVIERRGGDRINRTRQLLSTNNDLEAGCVHLEGLVGPVDALMLLDRALAATSAKGRPNETFESERQGLVAGKPAPLS